MKKLLTLLIAVCMILSAIPFTVAAENHVEQPDNTTIPAAPTAKEDDNTVYVSINGDDNADGTKEAPRKTLGKAYTKAVDKATKAKTKVATVCVLEEGAYLTTATSGYAQPTSLNISKNFDGTVYVFGRYNETTKSYATLLGTDTPDAPTKKTIANHIILGNDTVFYNIHIDNGSKNFTINATFHNLTIGENFSGKGSKGGGCLISGSTWDNDTEKVNYSQYFASPDSEKGMSINIYSGSFKAVHATHRDSLTSTKEITHPVTVNVYGETKDDVTIDLLQDVSTQSKGMPKSTVTFNVYGGTVTTFKAQATNKQTYLNYSLRADVTLANSADSIAGLKAKAIMNAKYCGVQDGIYDNTNSVRFVGIVDLLDYRAVGFEIKATVGTETEIRDFTTSCRNVYTTIKGVSETSEYEYTAKDLGGNYIFAVAIKKVPQTGTVTFEITPFVTTQGDTADSSETYYGAGYKVVYTDGVLVSQTAIAN